MELLQRINDDIKKAMLAREKDKLEALRAVKAAILLEQTSEGGSDVLSEEVETKLLQKLIKQRREAAETYHTQNRKDLGDAELFQADIISAYLPEQMDEAKLREHLKELIDQFGATSIKDLGKMMGIATKTLAGRADNKTVSLILKELLSD